MRSFYIAASSEVQRIAVERRLGLEKRGFKVTSRWHFVQLSINVPKSSRDMDEMARIDLKDIEEAEEFIVLTEPPNALASRIIITGNLRNWRHFFIMRTTQEAHPQMRQIMIPLLAEFKQTFPILFDDLEPNQKQSNNLRLPR